MGKVFERAGCESIFSLVGSRTLPDSFDSHDLMESAGTACSFVPNSRDIQTGVRSLASSMAGHAIGVGLLSGWLPEMRLHMDCADHRELTPLRAADRSGLIGQHCWGKPWIGLLVSPPV